MRTNNSVEASHRRLSSITQCEHPNLWKFIECLQNGEHLIHCQLIKINSGEKVEPNKKYLNYSICLSNLIMSPQPTILQQLESLARNSWINIIFIPIGSFVWIYEFFLYLFLCLFFIYLIHFYSTIQFV